MKETEYYSVKNNLKFLAANLWKKDKAFYFWGILKGVTVVLLPLLGILLQKSVLDGIIRQWQFAYLLKVVMTVTGAAVLVSIVNYWAAVGMAHCQGLNRMRFLLEIEKVFLRCAYEDAELSETQIELDKVSDLVGTSAPRVGINGMHNGMYEIYECMLGLLVFVSLVGKIHILLIVAVMLGTIGAGIIENWTDVCKFNLRLLEAPIQKKQEYFRNKLSKSGAGKDIRAYGCQEWLKNKLSGVIKDKEELQKKQVYKVFQKDVALSVIEMLQNGIAICWITLSCLGGKIGISDFFVYLTAVLQLSSYMGKFIKALNLVKYANMDVIEIRRFLDIEQENTDSEDEKEKESFSIRFEHVYFRYPESDSYLLKDLDFTIKKGEKIALVGNNGAGKTTMVKLLCGFYSPTKGRILFDGEDISKMDKGTLYNKISAVFQDIVVLPFSVAQNVSVCQENEMDEKKIKKYLALAGVAEKLSDIHAMIDKRIYESGIELSGGEKQKLVFARALYKDTGFLVLDEPTAALDPLAESRLYQKYKEISEGKTTIFISHRLASTSFCDRIILLENGKILEDGTHMELLKKDGQYAKMFQMQSQYYRKEIRGNA